VNIAFLIFFIVYFADFILGEDTISNLLIGYNCYTLCIVILMFRVGLTINK
jgi:hypothetical protein